jgi:hypothetical protein
MYFVDFSGQGVLLGLAIIAVITIFYAVRGKL